MDKQTITFPCGTVTSHSVLIRPRGFTNARPGVLVFPDWSGCNDFAVEKARLLAEAGYVALAVDLYGDGRVGQDNDEKIALMQPLRADPHQLRARLVAAFQVLSSQSGVQADHVFAIGFCFGGYCALELARSGTRIAKVASFHGLLLPGLHAEQVSAKVLVLHGYDDPMVPPQDVATFEQEMTQLKVDWQVHVYGGVMHSFTNPLANDMAFGTVYQADAARRSWAALTY